MITKCLSCGKIFDVEPSWKGQTATCDSCGKDFTVKKYIECPKCSQLTPETGDKCESCNSPILIQLKRSSQFKAQPATPSNSENYETDNLQAINQDSDNSTLPYSRKQSQAIDYDADKIALESVSGLMRFWIRLAAVGNLVSILGVTFALVWGVIATGGNSGEMVALCGISIPFLFFGLMGAKMMSDAANAKAKITYTSSSVVVVAAYFILSLIGIVSTALLATKEEMLIPIIKSAAILVNIYMFFIAWQLYRARAFAQARNNIIKEQTTNCDADEIAIESVSGLMRFWIRLAPWIVLTDTMLVAIVCFYGMQREGSISLTFDASMLLFIPIIFIVLMGAKMMRDSANAKAKITYNMLRKIIVIAYFIVLLIGVIAAVFNRLPMRIRIIECIIILFLAYTYFIAWRLYRARAIAQAVTITD